MIEIQEAERLLGQSVLKCWGMLPQNIQEAIFEGAASGKGYDVRSDLALRLHQTHPRTQQGAFKTA
ncbi:putative protein OS=Afipia felis OX=1035 GN=NCTC12722_01014 PE=4 SV=1 [Afipia felis]